MSRKGWDWIGILAVFSLALFDINLSECYAEQTALSTDSTAVEARNKCDTAAGHPRDPGRYLAGVPDEQLAPGPAIEACELATKLNPDVARLWFELGRAYWSVRRDTEAFSAFNEAARRDYAAAKKYLGDAYLEGRGLPTGEQQDAQRALILYKQSASGHFDDAEAAINEVQTRIDHEAAEAAKNRFDPSIFQRGDFMTALYSLQDATPITNDRGAFFRYISGFIEEFSGEHGKIVFLPDGQFCKPLLSGNTYTKSVWANINNLGTGPGNMLTNIIKDQNQGENDAIALFNRYGCQSDITKRIMANINGVFEDPKPQPQRPDDDSSRDKAPVHSGTAVIRKVYQGDLMATGSCVNMYHQWRETAGFGAFAVGENTHCGLSYEQPDLDAARNEALRQCRELSSRCVIAYVNEFEEKPTAASSTPASVGGSSVATEQLNVREAANRDATIKGQLSQNASVTILRQVDDGWVEITATCVDGSKCQGFVNGKYLNGVGPQPATSASAGAERPAFCDNDQDKNASEAAICGNNDLIGLDDKLSALYGKIIDGDKADIKDATKTAERKWVVERNSCGDKVDCLQSRYRERIDQLQAIVSHR